MDWRGKTIYQIYPKSFQDTNGDGWGDIPGITQKIPYLKSLGVDMVWISPFFRSPQKDNGYDIADYYSIDPKYGTMAQVEEMIQSFRAAGMDVMFDMVFNHTSTEHAWFQKALAGDPAYRAFYYLRDPKPDGSLPTNWTSKFGGPAWAPFGDTGKYYLCLYDKTQADLDWHNPAVRQALFEVVRFWMDKGVRGFRFDVLNVIGKSQELVDSTGDLEQEKALYTDTPIVHTYIQELNRETFGRDPHCLTVGEMSSTNVANSVRYSNAEGTELSMVFSFHHLKVDYEKGDKWTHARFDFAALKRILNEWQLGMQEGDGWNALFWNNHDQPRANARFGDPVHYPYETATLLATTMHCLRGTPYIYQGEEFGMGNAGYTDIHQYNDVETHQAYEALRAKGMPEEEVMQILGEKSRDNARTPMQWDDSEQGGFTTGTPWIPLAANHTECNLQADLAQEASIFRYYQQLIQKRKEQPILQIGGYAPLFVEHEAVFAYRRFLEEEELLVFGHFRGEPVSLPVSSVKTAGKTYRRWMGNERNQPDLLPETLVLGPYGSVVYHAEGCGLTNRSN